MAGAVEPRGNGEPVAACSLGPDEQTSRLERWRRLTERALVRRSTTPTGASLAFRPLDGVATELEELAAAEAECCGFAVWRVTRSAEGDHLLDVSTAPEHRHVVGAMLGVDGVGE